MARPVLLMLMTLHFLLSVMFRGSGAERTPSPFTRETPESFQQMPPANAAINFRHADRDLLSAAVFHETNRRRKAHHLPALAPSPKAREAAAMQAEAMAEGGYLSHLNPNDPERKTLLDRVRLAGLKPRFAAENIALSFGLKY